jgi:hypothetical protein
MSANNAPTVQVLVGFPVSTNFAGYFVLNNSTLSGAAVLAGATQMVDVSQWCRGQIEIDRGRNRETDQFAASTAAFTLRNDDRRFDPTNASGPYYPGILPRAPVQIFLAGQQIWGGYVDDYNLAYEMAQNDSGRGRSTVSVTCIDGFSLLANAYLNQEPFSDELSGTRILHVLTCNDVNYPSGYNLANGTMYMVNSTQNGNAALDHIQTVVASEGGWFYADRTGTLVFQDHNIWPLAAAAFPNGQFTFTDHLDASKNPISYNGSAMGYTDVSMLSASTLLYNRVQGLSSAAGSTQQVANDATSQAQYNIRTLSLSSLELDSDTNVLGLCNFYLARYKQPEVRFDTLRVEMNAPQVSAQTQKDLCALDIASTVICEHTPPGGGGARITKLSLIESMQWTLDNDSQSFALTIGVVDLSSGIVGLILDSSTYGLLDTDLLGLGDITTPNQSTTNTTSYIHPFVVVG